MTKQKIEALIRVLKHLLTYELRADLILSYESQLEALNKKLEQADK